MAQTGLSFHGKLSPNTPRSRLAEHWFYPGVVLAEVIWQLRPRKRRKIRARNRGPTEPVLTASEIGEFVFRPQAWHHSRARVDRTQAATQRIEAGLNVHKRRARQSDWIQAGRALRVALLVAAVAIVLLLLVVLTFGINVS